MCIRDRPSTGFLPQGVQLVAGDKRSAITGAPVIETHPERMPAVLCLASPLGCEGLLLLAGGVRCARPPATCCHPLGMKLFGACVSQTIVCWYYRLAGFGFPQVQILELLLNVPEHKKNGLASKLGAHVQVIQIGRLPNYLAGSTSKRSRFITLSHAATKSLTNFSLPSLLA